MVLYVQRSTDTLSCVSHDVLDCIEPSVDGVLMDAVLMLDGVLMDASLMLDGVLWKVVMKWDGEDESRCSNW